MYDSPYDIIKSLLRTEKGTKLVSENKYIFWVAKKANKIQIKKAVEGVYKVGVVSVNTSNVKPKPKKVRFKLGKTSPWKKAVVTLKKGNTIEMASS
ncbi:MAG: 50S ribosomal protein L23 [Candidatus Omnitrophica bacterium]|jgi:large subunit ribosomal protein L23|nr:50S ribosomal protein L23 [Candidatus Omnitrophota bacterium]